MPGLAYLHKKYAQVAREVGKNVDNILREQGKLIKEDAARRAPKGKVNGGTLKKGGIVRITHPSPRVSQLSVEFRAIELAGSNRAQPTEPRKAAKSTAPASNLSGRGGFAARKAASQVPSSVLPTVEKVSSGRPNTKVGNRPTSVEYAKLVETGISKVGYPITPVRRKTLMWLERNKPVFRASVERTQPVIGRPYLAPAWKNGMKRIRRRFHEAFIESGTLRS
jgi:hypothetical protein